MPVFIVRSELTAGETAALDRIQAVLEKRATPALGDGTGEALALGSGVDGPSQVLLALGLDRELAKGSLRVTVGRSTTDEQVDIAAAALEQSVAVLSRHSA